MILSASDISAKVRATFNFDVDKFRLSGPDGLVCPFYGLFRSDNSECVGNAVTAGYSPHTTDDVVALVDACAEAFEGVADVRCHFNHGHYVNITPTKEHRISIFGTNDNIFPRLRISARYDGAPFVLSMGWYRDLCRNMARLRSVAECEFKIRHTRGLRERMPEIIAGASRLAQGWENTVQTVKAMESSTVQLADFLTKVYGQPESTRAENRMKAIFQRALRERSEAGRPPMDADYTVTAWEAYNAVQGYAQWDASRKGSPDAWDKLLLADDDAAVEKAERLALAAC